MERDNIIGIDLAKNIFHACVMNTRGQVLRRAQLNRRELGAWVANQQAGIVAIEACGGSHYWARTFQALGFEVRMIAAHFVKPFVKSNKNDKIDAEAICEAASRPQMRFISTRTEEQQDVQNLHRIRDRLVSQRTALANEIRGFLGEYGTILPQGISAIRSKLAALLEKEAPQHSALWKETFAELSTEFRELDKRILEYSNRLERHAKSDERCKRLLEIPGVGFITASAIVAAVGNPADFKNGRQFAAWLGLVPKQFSSGGKQRLGTISKRGDSYLRKLLVQGALSYRLSLAKKLATADPIKKPLKSTERWFIQLSQRKSGKLPIVAMANKTARMIWVVLMGADFKHQEDLIPLAA